MATLRLPDVDNDGRTVSSHELACFIAGEGTAARRTEITALLAGDAALKMRHDALISEQSAADAALRLEVPLPRFLDDHAPAPAWWRALLNVRVFGAIAVGACAVLFIVMPGSDPAYDGLKGNARVGFFVKDAHNARFGHAGERLSAGDQIQFAVKDDASHTAMVLVGVDGRGAVTVYAAERVDGERPKGESKPRLLPDSVVLDDSTGAERFFVVFGDGTVPEVRAQVEDAAHKLAASHADLVGTERLPLADSFVQSSVHIVKVRQ